jgi:hypothetical protein
VSLQQQYSDIYGIPLDEIKIWCADFAKGNVPDSVKEWMEPTKEERIHSIKAYIQQMVDQSISSQIKADIVSGRIASSDAKVIAECPF